MSDGGAWDREGIEQPKRLQRISRVLTTKDYLLMGDTGNWPVLIVPAICIPIFILQMFGYVPLERYAFSAKAISDGYFDTALTSMFMHGGLYHIWGNMSAYLSLAPLVIARFGKGWKAVIPFHVFYLLCGLAGDAFFYALHSKSDVPMVGASGAIYGVMAAMFRLDVFSDRLWPVFSRRTLSALWTLLYTNIIVILIFGGPAVLFQILDGQTVNLSIPVAWEAHIGGFFAGFVLIGLMKGRGWDSDWRAGLRLDEARTES